MPTARSWPVSWSAAIQLSEDLQEARRCGIMHRIRCTSGGLMLGESEVRAANQRFYEALSKQNLLDMEEIWSHAPHVRCVHAGWGLVEGWEAIRNSWRAIFTRAICLTVVPSDPRVTVLGPTAIVTCREQITSFTLDGSTMSAAQATNVFEKRHGRWQLIHHHASPIRAEGPPATQ